MEITLTNKHRQEKIVLTKSFNKILLQVSREQCMDILLEVFNNKGQAQSKPLQKWVPIIKKPNITTLRFTMNDYSNKPITIKIDT